MRPLAVFMMVPFPGLFYWRNRAKAIPLFLLVASSVLVVGTVATLTGSVLMSVYRATVKPYETCSLVISKQAGIPGDLANQIMTFEYVEETVPVLDSKVKIKGLFGTEGRTILAIPEYSREFCLTRIGLRVSKGRLPYAGEDGIAIHEEIAKAKGISVGDLVGREVNPDDYLWGLFRVTGILTGDIPCGIASLEYFKAQWALDTGELDYAYLVFPREGYRDHMNTFLDTLPGNQVLLRTLETAERQFRSESQNMDLLLWLVNFLVIAIISCAMGLLNTVHLLGRMKEYGLLAAIGLTPAQLVRRAFEEVLILALAGYVLGIAAAKVVLVCIAQFILGPRGIQVSQMGLRAFMFSLPIPLMLSVFSFATIGRHLLRLDFVSIMEGRD